MNKHCTQIIKSWKGIDVVKNHQLTGSPNFCPIKREWGWSLNLSLRVPPEPIEPPRHCFTCNKGRYVVRALRAIPFHLPMLLEPLNSIVLGV